jgi:hypothetical protein
MIEDIQSSNLGGTILLDTEKQYKKENKNRRAWGDTRLPSRAQPQWLHASSMKLVPVLSDVLHSCVRHSYKLRQPMPVAGMRKSFPGAKVRRVTFRNAQCLS